MLLKATLSDWVVLAVSAILLALLIVSSFYEDVPIPLFILFLTLFIAGIGLTVVKRVRGRRQGRRAQASEDDSET